MKRIIFVGLHNKPHLTPLHPSTRTGKVIEAIIAQLPTTCETILTNIYNVECFPTKAEAWDLIIEWKHTYQPTEADIIVALGSHVKGVFKSYFPGLNVINAPHPAQRGSEVKRRNYIAAMVNNIKNRLA